MSDPLTDVVVNYLKELAHDFRESKLPVHLSEATVWERDADGVTRRKSSTEPNLGIFSHTHKEASTTYEATARAVANDRDFKRAVGSLVGDSSHLTIFSEDTVISAAMRGMAKADGSLSIRKDRVSRHLADLRAYVTQTHRTETIIIPLPGLKSYTLPFAIDDNVEIAALSGDEIGASIASGSLRPMSADFPILTADQCIGVRITISVPAEIHTQQELQDTQEERTRKLQELSEKPHRFGELSRWHLNDVVDDVLFVLRLARPEFIGTQGAVVLANSPVGHSRSWTGRPSRNFVHTTYDLDKPTGRKIRSTWKELKLQARKKQSLPPICIRRFNSALDRMSLDDAIIDYLIASEALFLKDAGAPEDRGELSFRLSLRAAVFIEGRAPQQAAVFKFIKKAYDLRSTIAHGGSPASPVKVPGRSSAIPLHEFVEELGSVMRRVLVRAIGLYSKSSDFGKPEYWESLIIHD